MRRRMSVLAIAATMASCRTPSPPAAPVFQPGLPEGWAQRPLFSVLLARAQAIEVTAATAEHVLIVDRSFYVGEQPALIGVVRRAGNEFRVRFPERTPGCDPWRPGGPMVIDPCLREDDGGPVVTIGSNASTGEDTRCSLRVPDTGVVTSVPLVSCPTARPVLPLARCPRVRALVESEPYPRPQHAIVGAGSDVHVVVIGGARSAGPGPLRYGACLAGGRDEVFEIAPRVSSAAVTLSRGRPLVAYVSHRLDRGEVVVAGDRLDPTGPNDARVLDGLEFCARIHIEYGATRPPDAAPFDDHQTRCAIVSEDAEARAEATAISDARCTAGDARACYVSGALRSSFTRRLRFEASAAGDRVEHEYLKVADTKQPEADDWYRRACTKGDDDGCTRVLLAAHAQHDPQALVLAAALCARGNRFGCDLDLAKR